MRYINPRFTYLLTYLRRDKFGSYGLNGLNLKLRVAQNFKLRGTHHNKLNKIQ